MNTPPVIEGYFKGKKMMIILVISSAVVMLGLMFNEYQKQTQREKAEAPIYEAGRSTGFQARSSGHVKPSGDELDAIAFRVIGSNSRARRVWESGFDAGWYSAGQ